MKKLFLIVLATISSVICMAQRTQVIGQKTDTLSIPGYLKLKGAITLPIYSTGTGPLYTSSLIWNKTILRYQGYDGAIYHTIPWADSLDLSGLVSAGSGINVSGSGHKGDPYVISNADSSIHGGQGNLLFQLNGSNLTGAGIIDTINIAKYLTAIYNSSGKVNIFLDTVNVLKSGNGTTYTSATRSVDAGGSMYANIAFEGHNSFSYTIDSADVLIKKLAQVTPGQFVVSTDATGKLILVNTATASTTFTASQDVTGTASGTSTLSPALTVVGLKGALLPSLTNGFLQYNSGWVLNPTVMQGANNGLSVSGTTAVLGQTVAQVGNPAQFLGDREIPLHGHKLFLDTGVVVIGLKSSTADNTTALQVYGQQSITTQGNSTIPLSITDNVDGFYRIQMQDIFNGANTGTGFFALNNLGTGLQLFSASSANVGVYANGVLIRSSALNGMFIHTDTGRIWFSTKSIAGGTPLVMGAIDANTMRWRIFNNVGSGGFTLPTDMGHLFQVTGSASITDSFYLYKNIAGTLTDSILTKNISTGEVHYISPAALTNNIVNTFSANTPLSYSSGIISIQQGTSAQNGYISSTDWNVFNSKLSSANNGLSVSGSVVSLGQTVAQAGNPANLLGDRELPLNTHNLFFNNGRVILGQNTTADNSTLFQVYGNQTINTGFLSITQNGATPITATGTFAGFANYSIVNSSNGVTSSAGYSAANNLGETIQLLVGSSTNSLEYRDAGLLRSTGLTGLILHSDTGAIYFSRKLISGSPVVSGAISNLGRWLVYSGTTTLPTDQGRLLQVNGSSYFSDTVITTKAIVGSLNDSLVTIDPATGIQHRISPGRIGAGGGTLSSIGLSAFAGITVTNSPLTSNGTLALSTTLNGILQGTGSGFSTITVASPLTFTSSTLGIANASANATTKGAATFATNDFNDNGSGLISLDYVNGQVATGTQNGFLSSTSFNSFSNKVDTIYRTPGKDSILFTINGRLHSILDSAGTSGFTNFQSTGGGPIFGTTVIVSGTTVQQQFTLNTVAPHAWLGNPTGSTSLPVYSTLTTADIPTIPNAGLVNSSVTFNGVTVSLGGTGTLFLASTNFTSQGTTTTVLHGNAAGAPSWAAINLTTDVSGALPIANGGTAATTATAAINNLLPTQTGHIGSSLRTNGTAISWSPLADTTYAGSGLNQLLDTIRLGGRLNAATTISGANAFPMILDSMTAATGRGFKVNFGSDAGWDLFTKDSITGFWTRIPKGTPGQALTMLSSGGIGWGTVSGGGGSGVVSVGTFGSQTASANGAVIVGTSIVFQSVTASVPGMLTTGAQSIAGVKTWTSAPVFSSLTTNGGIFYGNGSGALQQTVAGTTATVLHGGTVPTYSAIVLTTDVTGTLPIANGGTNATTAIAALNNLLPTQTGNSGSFLLTNGTNASWATAVTGVTIGNLSPLFTATVTNANTTPAISFTLSTAPGLTVYGNNSAGAANPGFFSPVLASTLFNGQGTTTTVLHGNAAGAPSWSAINLAADITGTLAIANGGTGATTAATAINNLLPSQTGHASAVLTTNGTTPSWSSTTDTIVFVNQGSSGINLQYVSNDTAYFPKVKSGLNISVTKAADSTVTVATTTDLTVRHLIGSGSAPSSITSLGTNVTSATFSGTDNDMKITIVTSGNVNGTIVIFSYAAAWSTIPIAVISCSDNNTAQAVSKIAFNATSTLSATMAGTITGAGTYIFNVHSAQ